MRYPAAAALLTLRNAYRAQPQASTTCDLAHERVHLSLVPLKCRITGAPMQRVELRAKVLTGDTDITRVWLRGLATRLGMGELGEPENRIYHWAISGVLAAQEAEVA